VLIATLFRIDMARAEAVAELSRHRRLREFRPRPLFAGGVDSAVYSDAGRILWCVPMDDGWAEGSSVADTLWPCCAD
jgi:hypothetical protein